MSEADHLWRAGDLGELRKFYADSVRADPATAAHRLDLADVLILQGDLERADAQLDLAAGQQPDRAVQIALTRQLVRAAIARMECFEQQRPPELVTEADGAIAAALARLAGLAPAGDIPVVTGTIDGRAFTDMRDADDRTAEVLEVLTSTGKYVWVSFGQIVTLRPHAPERPRELAWRRADLEVRGGPSGVVYLPAIYHAREMTDAQRLARATDWVEQGDDVQGRGLRTYLVGDDDVALGGFEELAITS